MEIGTIRTITGRAGSSYVIGGKSIFVVDSCFPSDAKAVLAYVRDEMHRNVQDIDMVVLTHSHLDHINGADLLVKNTEAKLAAHRNAEKYLTGKQAIPLPAMGKVVRFAGFMAKHGFPRPSMPDALSMSWSGIPGIRKGIRTSVSHLLNDNETLPNHPEWQVIYTPGHTDDSICLYSAQHRALFSGDTLINFHGRLRLNPILVLDRAALLASWSELRQLQVSSVYPGWGTPVFGEGILNEVCPEISID